MALHGAHHETPRGPMGHHEPTPNNNKNMKRLVICGFDTFLCVPVYGTNMVHRAPWTFMKHHDEVSLMVFTVVLVVDEPGCSWCTIDCHEAPCMGDFIEV